MPSLDPQVKALLDQMAANPGPQLTELDPVEARKIFSGLFVVLSGGAQPESVARCEDRVVPGPRGDIPVRIYTPKGGPSMPIVVFFHGGGWVIGDLETHDPLCRSIANGAGAIVLAVHYRLAPEHKFPAAPDDCYAVTRWASENGASLGGDPSKIAVVGDSAGGNLAAVVSLMARERGGPKIREQVLIYPAIDAAMDSGSQKEFAKPGYVLSREDMAWYWGHYLNSKSDADNPHACPSRAKDLSGLPPALVITAGFDPLRDEGEAYGERMRKAGIRVTVSRYPGVVHGFVSMAGIVNEGRRAIAETCAALHTAFA